MVGRCCIQGTQKGVCGSSPARSRLTSPTAQVHVRELGWTRGIEEEVRIESVRKATHILPSSVEPLRPTTHHIKNKSTLTIHIRKGPPVVLSMHLILRTPCTPQSQISLPLSPQVLTHGAVHECGATRRPARLGCACATVAPTYKYLHRAQGLHATQAPPPARHLFEMYAKVDTQ